ncbi:MAG: lipid II flippase MurJ [Planctomycetota bacterium]
MRLPPLRKLMVPLLLGAGIVATLGREIVFALGLGSGEDLEVFRLAFGAPNMMAQSLAPAFVGVMLPLLAHAAEKGEAAEQWMRQRILRFNFFGVLLLCVVGLLSAAPLATLLAPGYEADALREVTTQLRILWLFFGVTGMSFAARVFLNHRDVFWPGASTSLAVSAAFVLAGLGIHRGTFDASATTLSWAAIFGGSLVLVFQFLARPYRSSDFRLSGRLRDDSSLAPAARSAAAAPILLPLLGALLSTISASAPRFLDRAYASAMPQGSVAALEYSYNVLAAPGILLGTSFVMLAFPAFARGVAAGKAREAARTMLRPLGLTAGAALVISILVFFFAEPLVTLFYRRGAFASSDADATAAVLRWQCLGMMPLVVGMIVAQGFLGLRLVRFVLLLSAVRIVVRWLALELLVPHMQLGGLGLAYTVTETIALLVAFTLFLRRLPK